MIQGNCEVEKLTYMDCWNFIAPLIPIHHDDDYTTKIYVMVYDALRKAQGGQENETRTSC